MANARRTSPEVFAISRTLFSFAADCRLRCRDEGTASKRLIDPSDRRKKAGPNEMRTREAMTLFPETNRVKELVILASVICPLAFP